MIVARTVLFTVASAALYAQSFEVASVKTVPKGTLWAPLNIDPAHFSGQDSLRNLIAFAYTTGTDQVIGPDWLDSEMYSVNANIPAGATNEQVHLMLRNLLAERFRMTAHMETRIIDGYNLVVAKNGPKLKPAAEGETRRQSGSFGSDGATLDFPNVSMSQLIADLANFRLRTPRDRGLFRVIDKTGLTGKYDFTLRYAPAGTDAPGPDLFGALESQLGLKLEPVKISLDVVVVDRAEKIPLEN